MLQAEVGEKHVGDLQIIEQTCSLYRSLKVIDRQATRMKVLKDMYCLKID